MDLISIKVEDKVYIKINSLEVRIEAVMDIFGDIETQKLMGGPARVYEDDLAEVLVQENVLSRSESRGFYYAGDMYEEFYCCVSTIRQGYQ